MLAQNHAMLGVFQRSGLLVKQRHEGNVVHVTLRLERIQIGKTLRPRSRARVGGIWYLWSMRMSAHRPK